jgi:integrase
MAKRKKEEIVAGRVYKRKRRNPDDPNQFIESKCWWIQFYHHRQIRKPTKTENRAEAIRILNHHLDLAHAGKILPLDAERMKFVDLTNMIVRDYKRNERRSLDRAEDAIEHLSRYFGSVRPSNIDTPAIEDYIDYRKEVEHAASATVKYETSILKRGFRLARNILVRTPEFPVIKTANIRKGFFEEHEFRTFLECFEEDLQPLLKFAYITGWRMSSEIFLLQWSQVDFSVGEVRLEPGTTKTDEGRTFPFKVVRELEELLKAQKAKTDQLRRELNQIIPWVFHRQGRKIGDIRGAWSAALEKSKIAKKIPHDFRRTAVRNLERAGVPRGVAMKLVGHKTESIYQRYAIVAQSDLVDGLKRLAVYRENLNQEPKVVPIHKEEAIGG